MATKAKFKLFNGPAPTSAAQAAVATGTSIKTMLQIKSAGGSLKILEWGVSGSGAAVAAGIEWELLTTGTIAATVTAHVEAGCVRWPTRQAELEDGLLAASYLTFGTAATGYTASGEGTITETNVFDSVLVTPTDIYKGDFARRFNSPIMVPSTDYLRVRCTAAAGVNAICWVLLEAA